MVAYPRVGLYADNHTNILALLGEEGPLVQKEV